MEFSIRSLRLSVTVTAVYWGVPLTRTMITLLGELKKEIEKEL